MCDSGGDIQKIEIIEIVQLRPQMLALADVSTYSSERSYTRRYLPQMLPPPQVFTYSPLGEGSTPRVTVREKIEVIEIVQLRPKAFLL